jgi:hypothetical protein
MGHPVIGGHKYRDLVLQVGSWTQGWWPCYAKKNFVKSTDLKWQESSKEGYGSNTHEEKNFCLWWESNTNSPAIQPMVQSPSYLSSSSAGRKLFARLNKTASRAVCRTYNLHSEQLRGKQPLPIIAQLIKKFLFAHRIWRFSLVFTTALITTTLSQMNPIHTLISFSFKSNSTLFYCLSLSLRSDLLHLNL